MNRHLLGFAIAAILAPAAAPAQPSPVAAQPGATPLAGQWLREGHGGIIGSIKSVSPDGRTVTVVLGVYLFDNVRVIEVPASALSVMDGKATLRAGTAEALNVPPR